MTDSDIAEFRTQLAAMELRLTAFNLKVTMLVRAFFRADTRKKRKRVLREIKAEAKVHKRAMRKMKGAARAAAEQNHDELRGLRKTLRA